MKNQKGITLIALIITVIVLIILAAITIGASLNGGLFGRTKNAANQAQIDADKDELLTYILRSKNKYGEFDGDEFYQELSDEETGWAVVDNQDDTYTCTSANGNVFLVDEKGNITYLGKVEAPEEDEGGTTPEEDYSVPITYAKSLDLGENTNAVLVQYKDLEEGAIKEAVDNGKIFAVIEETVGTGQSAVTYTAVVPKDYKVSTTIGENTISGGLVIFDGENSNNRNNEFVWIPVPEKDMKIATTSDEYVGGTNKAEPRALTSKDSKTGGDASSRLVYDSQEELDYYYGENYFTYPDNISDENNVTDFSYGVHYKEMAQSVNKYGGFYIGRYETTIDGNNVGSKYNTEVLVSNKVLKSGTNENANTGGTYTYRWWGLYYAQRNANVSGNGSIVQTNMIWGQQWDKMLEYFDSESISYAAIDTINTYSVPSNVSLSGQATYTNKTDNPEIDDIKDEIFNIYDLRMNTYEWTSETFNTFDRVDRGGTFVLSKGADYFNHFTPTNVVNNMRFSSYTLY